MLEPAKKGRSLPKRRAAQKGMVVLRRALTLSHPIRYFVSSSLFHQQSRPLRLPMPTNRLLSPGKGGLGGVLEVAAEVLSRVALRATMLMAVAMASHFRRHYSPAYHRHRILRRPPRRALCLARRARPLLLLQSHLLLLLLSLPRLPPLPPLAVGEGIRQRVMRDRTRWSRAGRRCACLWRPSAVSAPQPQPPQWLATTQATLVAMLTPMHPATLFLPLPLPSRAAVLPSPLARRAVPFPLRGDLSPQAPKRRRKQSTITTIRRVWLEITTLRMPLTSLPCCVCMAAVAPPLAASTLETHLTERL